MRKKKALPLATIWMGLEGVMPSEGSQTEEQKHCASSPLGGIYKSKACKNGKQNGGYGGY